MTQIRWAPTLPSFGGRLAPRIDLPEGYPSDYNSKLELYYLRRQSCLSIFSHNIGARVLRRLFGTDRCSWYMRTGTSPRIEELTPGERYTYLLKGLGNITMSANFLRKLRDLCNRKDMSTIKRWWQTTDGVVYPLLISVADPDECYQDIDRLTKFSLENCANNYAHFTSRMKSLKRLLRKDYAEDSSLARSLTDVKTYRDVYLRHMPDDGANPHLIVQYILCWAQTRSSGLADSKMILKSLNKCEVTLTTLRRIPKVASPEYRAYRHRGLPTGEPPLPRLILDDVCLRVSGRVRGETAHLSAGPNACLESTRQTGGQTGHIKTLARRCDALHVRYDFRTFEREFLTTPVPVRNQQDLLSWSIQEALEHPAYVRCVRLHAVAEPSKARTITVCSLPYLLIVGVMAKLLQPAIASDITRGGLHASRNLWNMLFNDLDPNLGLWASIRDEEPKDKPILGLSSDLSEATDYGDIGVARQIFSNILEKCAGIPGFPIALGQLAKTLFIGKRFCFRQQDGRFRYFVKRNGWLMGDRITKVILTLAHEIVVISSGLHCARVCGDDVIAFSRDREKLLRYFTEVQRLGFQVSWEDSYVSQKLAFYCEEGCIPPQRFRELPSVCIRRKHQSMYIDYPRIRLLIPTHVETRAYSFTDVGRFSLLGKETRWVHQNGLVDSIPLFHRAGLLQHLNVAEPADTMCPYIPIELGGDGGFPPNSDFLKEVVLTKSRDFTETCFRMKKLLSSKWGFRFVRSPNLNDVVHKYHVLLPKLEELRGLIPANAIVEGNALLLGSIKINGLESPERTFFRVWRAWYWHSIFQNGREPPKMNLGVDRRFDHADDDVNMEDKEFVQFFQHWKYTGFTFRDLPDYLVDSREVHVKDYMNMGWWFGFPDTWASKRPTLQEIGGRKLLNEENVAVFIDHLKDGKPLSPIVAETIYKYVESDSYILADIAKRWTDDWTTPRAVILVSGDKRLALEIARIQRSRMISCPYPLSVVMVDPSNYLFGMMDSFEEWVSRTTPVRFIETILDAGAINYHAFTSSGLGEWYSEPAVYGYPLWGNPDLGVVEAKLDERSSSTSELWSLTTQPPDQVRKRLILRSLAARAQETPPGGTRS